MAEGDARLVKISLQDGWQAKLNHDGRLYYLDHNTKTSYWLPPPTSWSNDVDLPYGWEGAMDKNAKPYYINHVTCTTTREDPFEIEDIPPVEREVVLSRDSALGFGFIAGSEKPVLIRSVTEGGPSVGKLLPGDKILKINDEDVTTKEGQFIIERIRQSRELLRLTVIQPHIDKTGLKSSFLSAIKKQKLKAKPNRVRFSQNESITTISPQNTKVPPSLVYLPNVLKVYLENGQTKSFKYDNKTTVKDVLQNLQDKLGLRCMEYFSLVVQDIRNPSNQQLTILQDDELVRQTAARPGSQHLKCLLRVTFVPKDAYDLLSRDPTAFNYFYLQCCNDVVGGRFTNELKFEMAVKLAALQIQQHVLCNKQKAKISIKAIQKDDGLERFLPKFVIKTCKSKELRKTIGHHIKQNQGLTAPGKKHLTELQAKLHYLKILSELRSFGGKFYIGTQLADTEASEGMHVTLLVSPSCSVSQVCDKNTLSTLVNFSELNRLRLCRKGPICDDIYKLELCRKDNKPSLIFLLNTEDAQDMACLINGYYRLFEDPNHSLLPDDETKLCLINTQAPPYRGRHRVIAAGWNYPEDLVSEIVATDKQSPGTPRINSLRRRMQEGEHIVDLSTGPPLYTYDAAFISKLKDEKRFHPREDLDETDGGNDSGSESDSEQPVNRNANNSFINSSSDGGNNTTVGSMMDLSSLTDLVDSMFGVIPERPEDARKSKKRSPDKKRFSFSDAVRPKKRSNSSAKYSVSDTLATDEDSAERGRVKLLHFASFHDGMVRGNRQANYDSSESDDDDFVDAVPRRKRQGSGNPKAELKSRDSLYLIRTKINYSGRYSPKPDRLSSTSEDDYLESEDAENDVSGEIRDLEQSANTRESVIDLTMPSHDASDIDISIGSDVCDIYLGLDGDEEETDMVEHVEGASPETTEDIGEEQTGDVDLPVSVIDDISSPDTDDDRQVTDQAYGMQMAAIDALNASIQENAARPIAPDRDGSDSGNETISSETIDNQIDQIGFCHSPTDYFSIMDTSNNSDTLQKSPNQDRVNTASPNTSSSNTSSAIDNCKDMTHLSRSFDSDSTPRTSTPIDCDDATDTSTLVGGGDGSATNVSTPDSSTLSELLLDNSDQDLRLDSSDSVQNDNSNGDINVDCVNQSGESEIRSNSVLSQSSIGSHSSSTGSQSSIGSHSSIGNSSASSSTTQQDMVPGDASTINFVQECEATTAAIVESAANESTCDYAIQGISISSLSNEHEIDATMDSTSNTSPMDVEHILDDQNTDDIVSSSVNEIVYNETDHEINDMDDIGDVTDDIEDEVEEENARQETPTGTITHGSDTDSCASTLRGSSCNLTILEEGTDDVTTDVQASRGDGYSSDNTLEDDEEEQENNDGANTLEEVEEECANKIDVNDGDMDTIDDLIASLIVAPPPLATEADEELLDSIIPPPPVDDFDFGIIDVVPPPESCIDTSLHATDDTESVVSDLDSDSDATVQGDSPLSKYINYLKTSQSKPGLQTGSTSEQTTILAHPAGVTPRQIILGESLDSGFHQSDSCGDLESLSSCYSSLQEGQFIKEKASAASRANGIQIGLQKDANECETVSQNARETSALQKAVPENNVSIDSSETDRKQTINQDNQYPEKEQTTNQDNQYHEKETIDQGNQYHVKEAIDALDDALTLTLDDSISITSSTHSSENSFSSRESSFIASKQDKHFMSPTMTKPKPTVPPKPHIKPGILARMKSLEAGLGMKRAEEAATSDATVSKPTVMHSTSFHQSSSVSVVQSSDESPAFDNDLPDGGRRSPVKRSHTISFADSRRMFPIRKAPPIPAPKPKPKPKPVSGTWSSRPAGQTNTPSLRKMLSPGRSKPWKRGTLPFARSDETTKEPAAVKAPAAESKKSSKLPHKIFHTWSRKESSKVKNAIAKIDPPSLRVVSGLKRPSVLDLAERMQQAGAGQAIDDDGDSQPDMTALDRSASLRATPRTLPRMSGMQSIGVHSPRMHSARHSVHNPEAYAVPDSPKLHSPRTSRHSIHGAPPVMMRANSEGYDIPQSPRPLPSPRPRSMPCSPCAELPKRPPPPRPRAPPRTNSLDESFASDSSDIQTPPTPRVVRSSISSESSSIQTPPTPRAVRSSISSISSGIETPPTPRADRSSIPSESSSIQTPPTPRAVRSSNSPESSGMHTSPTSQTVSSPKSSVTSLSPDDDFDMATSPLPLPSPVPSELDYSLNSTLTSPPPLPSSAPPLPFMALPPKDISATDSAKDSATDSATDSSILPMTTPPSARRVVNRISPCNPKRVLNATYEIESKDYFGDECIVSAVNDIHIVVGELEDTMKDLIPCTPTIAQFRQCKQSLITEAREFTSNTKMIVSSAGQSAEQLVLCLNSSMHTLARMCSATQMFIQAMPSLNQAKNLGCKIKEIATNFQVTLQVTAEAHGKPLHDPRMQQLLRQAQTMAVMLSALMRTLRILHC